MVFPRNKYEISPFLTIYSFIENFGKNVLAGAHKKLYRVQHAEIYLLDLKVQSGCWPGFQIWPSKICLLVSSHICVGVVGQKHVFWDVAAIFCFAL